MFKIILKHFFPIAPPNFLFFRIKSWQMGSGIFFVGEKENRGCTGFQKAN